jgi:glycyl-tRNA synthetase
MSIGEAVRSGVVNNETLGYFMARTQLWAEKIGVNPAKMRFRQHLKTEMAHYAADCWDLEIKMSYGWIECVGHADRACYDLVQHATRTGVSMHASERLAEPVQVERVVVEANKKLLGPRFKTDQKKVVEALEALSEEEVLALKQSIESTGAGKVKDQYEITSDLVKFSVEKKTVCEQKYTPSVIEPSYGIGRILYAVLEHAFSQRAADEQRCVMAFKPCVAPIKVGIYRLINHQPFDVYVQQIKDLFSFGSEAIATRVDSSSGSLGRRYARSDELGIPFGVTVDFQTLLDQTVTLRDRDTMAQVRLPIAHLVSVVSRLIQETLSWETVMKKYVVVNAGGEDAEEGEESKGDEAKAAAAKAKASAVSTPTVIEYTARGSFSRPNVISK